jgi:superfamily II DNA/RNA helicase
VTQAFVFTNSKLGCGRLARALESDGLRTTALHGDKSQDERLKSLEAFKAGEVDLLVATDVAARGLDIKDVPAVFNFDLPFHAEDYVHRIGRTGRAGASGLAISLVAPSDGKLLVEIEKITKQKIVPDALQVQSTRRERSPYRNERSEHGSEGRGGYERRERPDFRQREEDNKPLRGAAYRPQLVSRDPFFSQPYASAERTELAAWEKTGKTPVVSNRTVSGNIRSKRKVAALFKSA